MSLREDEGEGISPLKSRSIQFSGGGFSGADNSACESGSSTRFSMRPASESATIGKVIRLAEPVKRKRPGRRSVSTACLMASNRRGAR